MELICSSCKKTYPEEDKVRCCFTDDCGWCHGDQCWDNTQEE